VLESWIAWRRTEEAARYIDLDRLAIGPQCGFASTVAGNPISEDDERAKACVSRSSRKEIWANSNIH
jgi:5-methyltetrahydropteroyltriglutamate--homocysteine methyltransferase